MSAPVDLSRLEIAYRHHTTNGAREAVWLDDVRALLAAAPSGDCLHDDTHREGAIWEVCDQCGKCWADDENPRYPRSIETLAPAPATPAASVADTPEYVGALNSMVDAGVMSAKCGATSDVQAFLTAQQKFEGVVEAYTARAVAAAVAPLKRANLELTRVNAEQRLQEQRLDLALKRAAAPQQHAQALVEGRTPDGRTIDLPVFGNGSKDGKNLLIVALPETQQHAQAALSDATLQLIIEAVGQARNQRLSPVGTRLLVRRIALGASHQPAAAPAVMPIHEEDQLIELSGALEQEWLRKTIAELRGSITLNEGGFKAGFDTALEEIETRCALVSPVQREVKS